VEGGDEGGKISQTGAGFSLERSVITEQNRTRVAHYREEGDGGKGETDQTNRPQRKGDNQDTKRKKEDIKKGGFRKN